MTSVVDFFGQLLTIATVPIMFIWSVMLTWWFWAVAGVAVVVLHRLWLPEFLQAVRGAGSNDQDSDERKAQS